MKLVDLYEMRARVLPGIVLAAPVLVAAYFCFGATADLGENIGKTGLLALATLTLMALVTREFGRGAEGRLWREWGGPPSRRLLMDDDSTWSVQYKDEIRDACTALTGLEWPSGAETGADRAEALRRIDDIFRQVRNILRREDPKGLWNVHNRDYGAARNLYGAAMPLVVLASVSSVVCIVHAAIQSSRPALAGVGLNVLIAVAALVGRRFLRRHVRHCAERYAESAWAAFLDVRRQRARSGPPEPARDNGGS